MAACAEMYGRLAGHHLLILPRLVVRQLDVADNYLLRAPTTAARLLLPNLAFGAVRLG